MTRPTQPSHFLARQATHTLWCTTSMPIVSKPQSFLWLPPPDHLVTIQIPPEYQYLKQVFSKEKASSLPPQRPYDCAIQLLPGTSPPWVYPLSARTTSYGGLHSRGPPARLYYTFYNPCFCWFLFCEEKRRRQQTMYRLPGP